MPSENVEVMRGMYDAWLRDSASAFDAFDAEIEVHPDPEAHWVGVDQIYRGHEGLREYLRAVNEAFEDYRPEVEDFLEVDDKVVTLAIEHGRGRDSGAEVESRQLPTSGRCGTARPSGWTSTSTATGRSRISGCGRTERDSSADPGRRSTARGAARPA